MTYPAEPHIQEPPEGCPDGGICHHECTTHCSRVLTCSPLSGVYQRNEWPEALVREHAEYSGAFDGFDYPDTGADQ